MSADFGTAAYKDRDSARAAALALVDMMVSQQKWTMQEADIATADIETAYGAADQWDLWSEEGGIEEAETFYMALYALSQDWTFRDADKYRTWIDSASTAVQSQAQVEEAQDWSTVAADTVVASAETAQEAGSVASDWKLWAGIGAAGLVLARILGRI